MKIWSHSCCVSMMIGSAHRHPAFHQHIFFIPSFRFSSFISVLLWFMFPLTNPNNVNRDTIGIQKRPKDKMFARVKHTTNNWFDWFRVYVWLYQYAFCLFSLLSKRATEGFVVVIFFSFPSMVCRSVKWKIDMQSQNRFSKLDSKSKWQKKTRDERENDKTKS